MTTEPKSFYTQTATTPANATIPCSTIASATLNATTTSAGGTWEIAGTAPQDATNLTYSAQTANPNVPALSVYTVTTTVAGVLLDASKRTWPQTNAKAAVPTSLVTPLTLTRALTVQLGADYLT